MRFADAKYTCICAECARVIVENHFEDAIKRARKSYVVKNAFNDERLD